MQRHLRAFSILGVLLGVCAPRLLSAQAAQNPTPSVFGPWDGSIQVANVSLAAHVVFTEALDGVRATIDIPQQRAMGRPLSEVKIIGRSVHFELVTGGPLAVFDGRIAGDSIAGTFMQGAVAGTFSLTRTRVQPAPPYREEEVSVTNGDITLAGTLTIPRGTGPFPVAVLITGSGPQDRDEDVLGFKVFRVIADYLTRQGVAVYRYDDRGVGRSTGRLDVATTADLAGDALAAIAKLKTRTDIDGRHIGLLGHSEGATAAAIAAGRSSDVAFAVLLAGPGLTGAEVTRQQAADGARSLGADEETITRIVSAHRKLTEAIAASGAPGNPGNSDALDSAVKELIGAQFDSQPAAQRAALGDRQAFIDRNYRQAAAQLTSPSMKFLMGFDPATALRQVSCPVLALFGSLDMQVPPAQNQAPVRAALAANARATVKVYDGANHLFQAARTGLVTEYATLDKAFVPGLLDEVSGWIRQVAAR
ncbi:MAG: alpha/beta fold hydrolase [Vicinamibacterales bacterium]